MKHFCHPHLGYMSEMSAREKEDCTSFSRTHTMSVMLLCVCRANWVPECPEKTSLVSWEWFVDQNKPFPHCLTFVGWTEIITSSIFDYRLDMLLGVFNKITECRIKKEEPECVSLRSHTPILPCENREIFQAHRYFLVFESSKVERLVCLKAPLHPSYRIKKS